MNEHHPPASEPGGRTKIFVKDLEANQIIQSHFLVAEMDLRTTKNGNPYLNLVLSDKTGRIGAKVWDQAEEAASRISVNTVIVVQGRTERYRDELQIHIQELDPLPMEAVNPADFLPEYPGDRRLLWKEFIHILAGIQNRALKGLVRAFLADTPLMTAFRNAPAAKSLHHAYLGGLLEHTVSVMKLVGKLSEHYPFLDRDLLLVGAFLHDIGKLEEYSWDLSIDYTDEGRLVGHMVLGVQILEKKLALLKDFPEEMRLMLKHLILSHHGQWEFGAVQLPMTREAVVLHLADELDARMHHIGKIMDESEGADTAWTPYQKLYNRYFYLGRKENQDASLSGQREGGPDQQRQLNLFSLVTEKRTDGTQGHGGS